MAPYVDVMSGLSGLTFAGTFVVIALVLAIFELKEFTIFRRVILYAILGLSGTAAVIWLLAIDQLTIMASPSITQRMFFRFYRYVANLWFIGYVLIILALIFFLLLTLPVLAMVVEVATFVVLLGYWRINNDWFFPLSKGDRSNMRRRPRQVQYRRKYRRRTIRGERDT